MAKISVVKVLLKANSHEKNGEIAEARKLYQKALQAFPKNKNLKQRLANLTKNSLPISNQSPSQEIINQLIYIYDQGQFVVTEEQAKIFTKKYPKIKIGWTILGVTQNRLGKIFEASQTFKNLTKLDPYYAEGFINFGITTQMQGNLGEAIEAYKKALSLKPNYAEAYNNMGNAFKKQNSPDKAIEAYKKALSLKPDYAEAYFNMGDTLRVQGKLNEAIEAYKKVLLLKPDYAEAYYNIGLTLYNKGKLDEAIEAYNNALSLRPDYTEVYNNIGLVLDDKGKLNDAIETYAKVLSLKPNHIDANWNQSLALLSKGEFGRGWAQYEKRWERSNYIDVHFQSTKPRWEPNRGGSVLVWLEQGLGDLIMFSSIIPELYKQCKKLIVQTDDRLIPLFIRSFSSDIIYYGIEEKIPEDEYDYHIPIGSLPLYFRTDLQS